MLSQRFLPAVVMTVGWNGSWLELGPAFEVGVGRAGPMHIMTARMVALLAGFRMVFMKKEAG